MKYKSRKVEVDGIVFDSEKEANRYSELKLLERAGEIQDLRCQWKFVLIPAQIEFYDRYSKKTGKKLRRSGKKVLERECAYIADFVYWKDGEMIVEDTKGFKTKEYIIKRKLMLKVHGIKIREV